MLIEFFFPRESEADVIYDEKENKATIEPYFSSPIGNRNLGFIRIVGSGGVTKEFGVTVYGRSGRVQIFESKKVDTLFDKSKPGDKPKPKKDKKADSV